MRGYWITLGLSFAVLFALSSHTLAACIDYGNYLHWVGGLRTPGFAYQSVVIGDYAFVADDGGGLQVVDVSAPRNPVIVANVPIEYGANGIARSGSYVYVVSSDLVAVVDVSTPTSPVIVTSLPALTEYVTGATVDNQMLYVTGRRQDADSNLGIYDVTNPANPQFKSRVDLDGDFARCVAVSGSCAYIAAGISGLHVLDVSDPSTPQRIGGVDTPGEASWVCVAGAHAYIADDTTGLVVVDVAEPTAPQIVHTAATGNGARGVTATDDLVLLSDVNTCLHVYDITDPGRPRQIGRYSGWNWQYGFGVTVAGNHAYLADGNDFDIVDISNPHSPRALTVCDIPFSVTDVAVVDRQAYVVSEAAGLAVLDVADMAASRVLGTVTVENPYAIAVCGQYAYTAGWYSGLSVVDVSNGWNPVLVSHLDLPEHAIGIAVAGECAYVAGRVSGLHIVDVADPLGPELIASLATPGWVYDVAVKGDYAYLAEVAWFAGLQIVDIADPAHPYIVSSIETQNLAWGVDVEGDYAYLVITEVGLVVVDIGDPLNPKIVASAEIGGFANDVDVVGNIAYVATDQTGLQVFDVSDPLHPSYVGGQGPSIPASRVTVAGDRVFLAANKLEVFPVQCTEFADSAAEIRGHRDPMLLSSPNPAHGSVAFRLTLPEASTVVAAIYDAAGRLVRHLPDQTLDAGAQTIFWDGRDGTGRPAAGGVYLVRVSTGSGSRIGKTILIR